MKMKPVPFAKFYSDIPEEQLRSFPIKWNRPKASFYKFEDLAAVVSPGVPGFPGPDWNAVVDREHKLVMFCEIDGSGDVANLFKCLRIRSYEDEQNGSRLVPSVFFDDHLLADGAKLPKLVTSSEISSFEDVMSLMEIVDSYTDCTFDLLEQMETPVLRNEDERNPKDSHGDRVKEWFDADELVAFQEEQAKKAEKERTKREEAARAKRAQLEYQKQRQRERATETEPKPVETSSLARPRVEVWAFTRTGAVLPKMLLDRRTDKHEVMVGLDAQGDPVVTVHSTAAVQEQTMYEGPNERGKERDNGQPRCTFPVAV